MILSWLTVHLAVDPMCHFPGGGAPLVWTHLVAGHALTMAGWLVEQEPEGRKGQAEALGLADSGRDNKPAEITNQEQLIILRGGTRDRCCSQKCEGTGAPIIAPFYLPVWP